MMYIQINSYRELDLFEAEDSMLISTFYYNNDEHAPSDWHDMSPGLSTSRAVLHCVLATLCLLQT